MCCKLTKKLLALIPSLRAFAFCLTQDRSKADDLVHGSLIETWAEYAPGMENADLKIAAFAAVHKQFRQSAMKNLPVMLRMPRPAERDAFAISFTSLPRSVRAAVSLVEVWNFRVEDAAEVCCCDRRTTRCHCPQPPDVELATVEWRCMSKTAGWLRNLHGTVSFDASGTLNVHTRVGYRPRMMEGG